jgi:hypothetical protein
MIRLTFNVLGMVFIAGITVATETTDFARYQSIIDRPPFGQVQSTPTDAPPNWLANYVFCGVVSNSGNAKVQAIITTKDNNRSVFRAEGETVDSDVTIQKIDLSQKSTKLVLKKGLETGTLAFPERTAVAMAAPGAPLPPGVANPPPGAGGAAVPPTIRRIPFRRGN